MHDVPAKRAGGPLRWLETATQVITTAFSQQSNVAVAPREPAPSPQTIPHVSHSLALDSVTPPPLAKGPQQAPLHMDLHQFFFTSLTRTARPYNAVETWKGTLSKRKPTTRQGPRELRGGAGRAARQLDSAPVTGRPGGARASPHNNAWPVRRRTVSRHAHGYMTHWQFHMRQYAAIRECTSTGQSAAVPTAQDCIPFHVSTALYGRAVRVRDVKKNWCKSM